MNSKLSVFKLRVQNLVGLLIAVCMTAAVFCATVDAQKKVRKVSSKQTTKTDAGETAKKTADSETKKDSPPNKAKRVMDNGL